MNNNIFRKFMGLFLAFVMMISIIPTNVCAQGNIINVDGYDVQILEDSTEREVVKLVMEDGIYIMTHNLFKDDYILEKQSRGKNFARSLFKTSNNIEMYKVNVESFNENELVATIQNSDVSKNEIFKIDQTLDEIQAQASLVIGVGVAGAIGVAAAALVKAILALCAGVVIAGATYYTASKVIAKLKKKQQDIKYYVAIRHNDNVYISVPLKSKSAAANILRVGKDVFAIASGYAYDACKSASPINKVSKPQKHGTGTGYFWHYHLMMKPNVQGVGHCFY